MRSKFEKLTYTLFEIDFFFLNAFFSLRIIIGHSHNQRNTEYYSDT